MASPVRLASTFRFGPYSLDAYTGELRKSGIPIKLRFQAVQVLHMLAKRAGQVVTREEIRERLWSKDTFVDFERGINFCINQIRSVLGDDADKPRFVETLPRRGYRFIALVTVEVAREAETVVTIAQPANSPVSAPDRLRAASPPSAGIQVVPDPHSQATSQRRTWRASSIAATGAAVLILAGGLAMRARILRGKSLDLQDLRIKKLTNNGRVTDVAISPDGRYAAYSKLEGDKQGLWLRQIAAQNDVQILAAGTGFHGLTFSPDGDYIYFVRSDERNPWFKYLFSMPAVGGPVKKLLTDVDSPVSFSPDGRKFVYEHCVENRDDIELRMADADGNNDHVFAVIHQGSSMLFQPGPSWSPDGRTIAVPASLVGPKGRWVLDTVSVNDGAVRELLSRDNFIGRPVWLHSGSLLLPLYDAKEGTAQLWTVSFPEGSSQRLTNDLGSYGADINDYDFPFDAAKDRKTFLALSVQKAGKVWVASPAEPEAAKELAPDGMPFIRITEAPDGKFWAVSSTRQLWILSADGGQAAPYGNFQLESAVVNCGPFMVVEHKEKPEGAVLTRFDTNAQHPQDLVSGNVFGTACSPEGKFIYYASMEQPQKIWRIEIDGGTPVQIASVLGDQISNPLSVSPDGTLICYGFTRFLPAPEWNVAVIPAKGGPPLKVMPLPPAEGVEPYWSPDGRALQYLWTNEGVTNLWEQSLSGGSPRRLTHFKTGRISAYSWSMDRKRLFLSRSDLTSDAVLLTAVR